MNKNTIVTIEGLSRQFAENRALNNVNLAFDAECIHGVVGENGAGKSTLIKHILGLYKAQQGSVSVFGLNPARDPSGVLSQIGYVSEEPELPAWMTISEYLNYMSAFYPGWDKQFAQQLIKTYELNPKKKTGELSKGQRARVALCAAQAHRPRLLLLDEPSSGLDPVVRRDILNVAMQTVRQDGRTVIFSSHLLDEVESISDQLVMIKKGEILLSDSLENIVGNHHRFTFKADSVGEIVKHLPGVFSIQKERELLEVDCFSKLSHIVEFFKKNDLKFVKHKKMDLSEVFFARSQETGRSVA